MSISLPNGTLLATPAQQTQYTAAVTRILHLSDFSAELKTRDLQAMFKESESLSGGFRIKWVDDTNALVVFADATIAKRAYLSFLLFPPPNFAPPAKITPYDKPDANQIIQSLSARAMGHRNSASNYSQQVQVPLGALPGNGVGLGSGVDGLPGQGQGQGLGQGHGHGRTGSFAKGVSGLGAGGSGWTFPTRQNSGGNGSNPAPPAATASGSSARGGVTHGRTGSATFSRSSIGGAGGGIGLGIGSAGPSTSSRAPISLPTHTESIDSPALPAGFSTTAQPGVGGGSSRRLTGRHGGGASQAGMMGLGMGMGIGGGGAAAFGQRNIGAVGNASTASPNIHDHSQGNHLERPMSRTTEGGQSVDSSDNEPIVIMDEPNASLGGRADGEKSGSRSGSGNSIEGRGKVPFGQWKMPPSQSPNPNKERSRDIDAQRRDSVSADKALREVQKALASVEAQ